MANNCISEIAFYSEDKTQLEEMCKTFQTILKEQMNVGEWNYGFIGDYVKHYFSNADLNSVDCAGAIVDVLGVAEVINSPYYSFWIFTDTKWDAKIGVFKRIVDEFYPNVKIAYYAYEPLGEYFLRWDESGLLCPNKYYVSGSIELEGQDEVDLIDLFGDIAVESKEKILKDLEEYLPFEFEHSDNLTKVSDSINEHLQEGSEIFLSEFEEVSPEEFAFYLS